MVNKIHLTKEGFEKLKKDLEKLKKKERPENIKAIEKALAHGDLSENAEYSAAKERQSFIEGKINELEYKIANAEVIIPDNNSKDKIFFASTMLIEDIETGEEHKYQIVGTEESDVKQGRISLESPLGRAALGKEIGDEIIVNTPNGKKNYEIVDII